MERVSHWSEDRYWTDALQEIYRMRESGRTRITLDLRAIDDVAFNGDGPAYKLMDAMRSVWELEGYEGFRGAPRVMLALLVRLQGISDERADGEAAVSAASIPQTIEAFNRSSTPEHRIATELGPCFYEGAEDAPLVLLTLKPGFDRTSTVEDHRVRFEGWPLAGLHPRAPEGLHKWWTDRVSQLAKVVPVQTIAQRLQNIPLFPWASGAWHSSHARLLDELQDDVEGQAELVRRAMERKALIVMTRAFDLWFRAVPELQRYDRLVQVKNRRLGAFLTPANLGGQEQFAQVIAAIGGYDCPRPVPN